MALPDLASNVPLLSLLGSGWAVDDSDGGWAVEWMPHPVDSTRSILTVAVPDLDIDGAGTDPTRTADGLRMLLALNADVLAPQGWAVMVNAADELLLSCEVPLDGLTLQMLSQYLAQGFSRAEAVLQIWRASQAPEQPQSTARPLSFGGLA